MASYREGTISVRDAKERGDSCLVSLSTVARIDIGAATDVSMKVTATHINVSQQLQ
jgi:hypothetical protein